MAFDLNTAKPLQQKMAFDLSTARPAPEESSLTKTLSSSQPQKPSGDPVIDALTFAQKEIVGPLAQGANTALFGIPRYATKAIAGDEFAKQAFPQQSTAIGKVARFGSETAGFVGGGVGQLATRAGLKVIPKIAAKEGIGKVIKRRAVEGAVGGVLTPTENIGDVGQRVANTAIGTVAGPALGAVSDKVMGAFKPKDYTSILNKNAAVFRNVLKPNASEIRNFEIKGKKDLNDAYRLASKEKLIIDQTPEGKLDTGRARQVVSARVKELNNVLDNALSSDKSNRFSLEDVRALALKKATKIKDSGEYYQAVNDINQEVNDSIKRHGNFVNGQTLNEIKQGLWGKTYNMGAPNANRNARIVGNSAKELIENGYKSHDIRAINDHMGKYLTLDKLLENATTKVVNAGKIGKYAGGMVGSLAGATLKVPVLGPIVGNIAGESAVKWVNDPSRITRNLAKKLEGMPSTKINFSKTPPPAKVLGLLAPVPSYLQQRQSASIQSLGVKGKPRVMGIPAKTPIPMNGEVQPEIPRLPSPSQVSPKLHEFVPVSDYAKGEGFVMGRSQNESNALNMYMDSYSNMMAGKLKDAHVGNLPISVANSRGIPNKIMIDKRIAEKLATKHGVNIDENFIRSINNPDYLMFSKEQPGKVNILKKLDNGETLVVGANKFKNHYIVTGLTTDKQSYIDSIKSRGDVIDVAGRTPSSPSLDPKAGRQPERLSGVSNGNKIPLKKNNVKGQVMGGLGVGATVLGLSSNSEASQDINMDKIYKIESSGNPQAVNKSSKAKGLGQITPIVLKEWNNLHPKDQHKDGDLFDAETNKKIASWYMNKRIPQMLKHYKIEDNTRNRLVAYNAGIETLTKKKILKKETADYIKKYNA